MSVTINSLSVNIGSKVKFRTINNNDSNIYHGEVSAFSDYTLARIITDIANYQEEVKKDTPSVPLLVDLNFLILTLDDPVEQGKKVAIAQEWIQSATFELLDDIVTLDIQIRNVPTSQVQTVLQVLRDANFTPELTSQ